MSFPETLLVFLVMFCELCFSEETCLTRKFHHRPEQDNKIFTESLLSEHDDISRLGCISKCSSDASCQLITYNPSSRSCRLHSDSLSTGTEETGWLYYGIDCDHFVFPRGDGVLPGQFTLDSCAPGYVLVSPLSGASCYRAGYWIDIDEGCVPDTNNIRVPVETLTNGTEIVVDALIRIDKSSKILFYKEDPDKIILFRILFTNDIRLTSFVNGSFSNDMMKSYETITRGDRVVIAIRIIGNQELFIYFNDILFAHFRTNEAMALTSYFRVTYFKSAYSIRVFRP